MKKIKKIKIVIPNPPAPVGNYVAYNIIGKVVYISVSYQLIVMVN